VSSEIVQTNSLEQRQTLCWIGWSQVRLVGCLEVKQLNLGLWEVNCAGLTIPYFVNGWLAACEVSLSLTTWLSSFLDPPACDTLYLSLSGVDNLSAGPD
jgi:hypothetical protein